MSFHKARKMRVVTAFITLALVGCVAAAPGGHQPLSRVNNVAQLFWRMAFGENAMPKAGTGIECAACTAVVGLVEQLAYVHSTSIDNSMEKLCGYLPAQIQPYCKEMIEFFGPTIISMLDAKETPDAVCLYLGVCGNATCHLFPLPKGAKNAAPQAFHYPRPNMMRFFRRYNDWNPIDWIKQLIEVVFGEHLPLLDLDGDRHSTIRELRGFSWRGKDCDDGRGDIYPGRASSNYGPEIDHDCNGIYGINITSGNSWEDELCSGTPRYGTILLGDSAGAHFHIPPQWLTASQINGTTFADLIPIMLNELDWPQMGASTGYQTTTWSGAPVGPVKSFYLKSWENNHCSHRDYQCIAVNGMRASAMTDTVKTVGRNQVLDRPAFVTYALVGNDVCNSRPGDYTSPQSMLQEVTQTMQYLDTILPSGSKVTLMGLVDGRVLYDAMHKLIHPIGSTFNDVTYSQFYDYMNCLRISPCFGWMNTDEYWRNQTWAAASALNSVLRNITLTQKYQHFDMLYLDTDIQEVIDIWTKKGGKESDLIEPVDGFHPTQVADALLADIQLSRVRTKYPSFYPPVNPNNAIIEKLFGDQGGYD